MGELAASLLETSPFETNLLFSSLSPIFSAEGGSGIPPRPSKIHPRWASLKLSPAPPMDGARLAVGRFPAKLGPTTHEINCCGSRLTSYHRQPHNPTYFSMFLSLSDSLSIPLSVYLCASLSLSLSLYLCVSLSLCLTLAPVSFICSRSLFSVLTLGFLFSLYFCFSRSLSFVLTLFSLLSLSFFCSRSLSSGIDLFLLLSLSFLSSHSLLSVLVIFHLFSLCFLPYCLFPGDVFSSSLSRFWSRVFFSRIPPLSHMSLSLCYLSLLLSLRLVSLSLSLLVFVLSLYLFVSKNLQVPSFRRMTWLCSPPFSKG